MAGFSGPVTFIFPKAPLLNALKMAWSTITYSPGTVAFKFYDCSSSRGIKVVCTSSLILLPPSMYTLSKISPITWKEEVRLGPPFPYIKRTVSPTLA